jgi:SAM-dependent methyltransferase
MPNIRIMSSFESRKTLDQKPGEGEWYKTAVGGMWELIGNLQFDFLVKNGLKSEHYLLDVGCGSLRGGIHFISYLSPGHYYGIDRNLDLLAAGEQELIINKLSGKKPILVQMSQFEFQSLDRRFEFALAQSVFTHLTLNSILRCIVNIEKILVKGGRFFCTFFEFKGDKRNLEPLSHPCFGSVNFPTYPDKDPFHYSFETFEWLCEGLDLRVEYLGDWGHPRDQKMMVFHKT